MMRRRSRTLAGLPAVAVLAAVCSGGDDVQVPFRASTYDIGGDGGTLVLDFEAGTRTVAAR